MSFSELCHGLDAQLASNLSRFSKPTPIQYESIPLSLTGHDLIAIAPTGSGKTVAFLVPLLHSISKLLVEFQSQPSSSAAPQYPSPIALIVSPTRELCLQICEDAQSLSDGLQVVTHAIYGGEPIPIQLERIHSSGVHLLVATPGRIIDMIERRCLTVSHCKCLVLDEADRLLDMGFEPQLRALISALPTTQHRQTLMFSATFDSQIQELARQFLSESFKCVTIVASSKPDISERFLLLNRDEKLSVLQCLLLYSIPRSNCSIVFCATKQTANFLFQRLRSRFRCCVMHGDRNQEQRKIALDQFRSGECPILVGSSNEIKYSD